MVQEIPVINCRPNIKNQQYRLAIIGQHTAAGGHHAATGILEQINYAFHKN